MEWLPQVCTIFQVNDISKGQPTWGAITEKALRKKQIDTPSNISYKAIANRFKNLFIKKGIILYLKRINENNNYYSNSCIKTLSIFWIYELYVIMHVLFLTFTWIQYFSAARTSVINMHNYNTCNSKLKYKEKPERREKLNNSIVSIMYIQLSYRALC